MEKIVSVEADLQKPNQRIVASSEENKGYHIDDGKHSCSSSQLGHDLVMVGLVVSEVCAVGKVGCDVGEDQKAVKP